MMMSAAGDGVYFLYGSAVSRISAAAAGRRYARRDFTLIVFTLKKARWSHFFCPISTTLPSPARRFFL